MSKLNCLSQFGFSFVKLYTLFICLLSGLWSPTAGAENEKFQYTHIVGKDWVKGETMNFDLKQSKLGTIVFFLSVKCPCSRSHEAALNQLVREFAPKGFQFIGIHCNVDEDVQMTQHHFGNEFRKREGKLSLLEFPVIQDEECRYAKALKALYTPHAFLIRPNLEILFQGGVDNSHIAEKASRHYLRDYLTDAIIHFNQNRIPESKNVRVLGCFIQREKRD